MVRWGQWVVGPPGSGKTTYCHAVKQLCRAINREVCIVNLDPANDTLIHDTIDNNKEKVEVDCRSIFDIDIRQLIAVEDAMNEYQLGPNGALLWSMEFIYENLQWLKDKLNEFSIKHSCFYYVFDCPGQTELYSVENKGGMRKILKELTYEKQEQNYRLTAVHLVDSTLITDLSTYVSCLFVSLNSQVMLELPYVNLLSKVDLLSTIQSQLLLPFREYAQVNGIGELIENEARKCTKTGGLIGKRRWLFVRELLDEITDANLTDFDLLDIHSQKSMMAVLGRIDRANGVALAGSLGSDYSKPSASSQDVDFKMTLSQPLNVFEQSDLFNEIVERHCEEVPANRDSE